MKLLCILLLVSTLTQAQDFLKDAAGRPIMADTYADVQGDPYLFAQFRPGLAELRNGKRYDNVVLNIDLIRQEVLFINESGRQLAFNEEVSAVVFKDTLNGELVNTLFRNGYPATSSSSAKDYFQVLAEGKLTLLKRTWKVIWQEKTFNSATVTKNILTKYAYCVFEPHNNVMRSIKLNAKTLLMLFSSQEEEMKRYLQSLRLDVSKEGDLVKIFAHYNAL